MEEELLLPWQFTLCGSERKKRIVKYFSKPFNGSSGELEMQLFFEENLTFVFPRLVFFGEKEKSKKYGVGHEWTTPYGGEERVDILAFFQEKDERWKSLAIIECKLRNNKRDAREQLKKSLQLLEEDKQSNYEVIKGLYNDYRRTQRKQKIEWGRTKEHLKNFWKDCRLICIAEVVKQE